MSRAFYWRRRRDWRTAGIWRWRCLLFGHRWHALGVSTFVDGSSPIAEEECGRCGVALLSGLSS